MLGVFSGVEVTRGGNPPSDIRGEWSQWRFREDGVVEFAYAQYGELQEPILRTWEIVSDNRVVIFPGDVEGSHAREHDSWWITRRGKCGPFGYEVLRDGEPETPDTEGQVYPGEICAIPVICPDLGPDVVCHYQLVACPGSPPPCGDDE